MTDRKLTLLAIGIAAAIIAVVLPALAWPHSAYGLVMKDFQTLVGGGLAAVAAAVTAIVVYRSATYPVREAQRREWNEVQSKKRFTAHILSNAARDLAAQLTNLHIDGRPIPMTGPMRGSRIDLPADLLNRELLALQEPDIVDAVMHLTANFQEYGRDVETDLGMAKMARRVEQRL